MTVNSIFDDDFTKNFFQRRGIQFPSPGDSSNTFEEARRDMERIVKSFKQEMEAIHKRIGGNEFPSKALNEDPFAFSKSLTNFAHNDKVFDSSRAIESGPGTGTGISNIRSSNINSLISNNNINSFGNESSTPGKYSVTIPLGNRIQPEDLKISLKEENGLKIMSIEAKREEKSDDTNSKSFVSQSFSRKFTLPPNVEINEVQSILTEGGNLKIEAPLKELPAPQPQKQISHQIPNQVAVKRYAPTRIPISIEK